ncbi:MAG: hypothetical protein WC829_00625 [Hyphomicrobium sp.]|jgi:hypothetical protein
MPPDSGQARVDRYRESLRKGWRHNGDSYVWPIKLSAAMHLFAKAYGDELIEDINALEASGKSLAEIARPFYNPARPYRLIDYAIYSMRRNRCSLKEQRQMVLRMLDMMRSLKDSDEFTEDGRSIIYRPTQAKGIADHLASLPPASLAESQVVHRFCAAMWAYTEAIWFRAHDVTKEFHGPYAPRDDQHPFVVKEYMNLSPRELWPDEPLLECQHIVIYKSYRPPVRARVDCHNRVFHEGGALIPHLDRYSVSVDGVWQPCDVLPPYVAAIQRAIPAIARVVEQMNWNEVALKYADIFWFRKKPLTDQRGRDWRVPESVRDAVRAGKELDRRRVALSEDDCEKLALLTI